MIHKFREAIASSGVLTDVEVRDDIVVGRARVLAAQADVWVNVDPELEDGEYRTLRFCCPASSRYSSSRQRSGA